MYDPEADEWQAKPATAAPREQVTAQAAGQVIYVIGGLADGQTLNKLEAYSPAANTWLGLKPMPTDRSALASAVLRNRIHVLGGADGTGAALATYEVYNPDLSTWSPAPPMPTARRGLTVQAVGDKLYAIGGTGADGAASAVVEIFTPSP
jgi:N-acetylneuraminic acid mutarotase